MSLVRGTLILAGATLLCRILGLIYYFPFLWLVGLPGAALYAYAYNPYTLMLSLSTMGLPLAVSKLVAKYHALGDYQTPKRLLSSGLILLLLLGLGSCGLLMSLAPAIAKTFIGGGGETAQTGNSLEDIILVIRVVSLALIVVPTMSLIRGYFQGLQDMLPTAVSQVVEQLVRIGFILISAVLIIQVWHGTRVMAVVFAVAAAFVGAVGGLLVLAWFWHRHQTMTPSPSSSPPESNALPLQPLPQIYLELIRYAVPFVLVSLAIPLYLLIDSMTINATLRANGLSLAEAENIFSVINQTTHKIIMIPVSLATAMGLTLIPTITRLFTAKETAQLQHTVNHTLQLLLFLTLPAVTALTLLAQPIYGVLYALQDWPLGSYYLLRYAPTALLFAFFTATAAILQGINQQKMAVLGLGLGLILKGLLNVPLLQFWGGEGAIWATNVGYLMAVLFNLRIIQAHAALSTRQLFAGCRQIVGLAAIMGLVVGGLQYGLFAPRLAGWSYAGLTLVLAFSLALGAVIYLGLALSTGVFGRVLGTRFRANRRR